MKTAALSLLIAFLFFEITISAQKGKHGNATINSSIIVNEYTRLTADAAAGATTISVVNSTLNSNGRFADNLEPGDLILIIQMQGPTLNAQAEWWAPNYGSPHDATWGAVTNYNNCGNNEFITVSAVPNATSITLECPLSLNYTASGKVQVIRVPRYNDLTINSSGTITTSAWNGNEGGIVAIEVNNNLLNNGSIDVKGLGFRGGVASIQNSGLGNSQHAVNTASSGGQKGEGIFGYASEYDPLGGGYCKGAAANGGGGATSHNAGGGGGGNAGQINNWNNGVGNPLDSLNYNTAWALETPSIAGINSSGGGRGGYSLSTQNRNAITTAPGNTAWQGDNRRDQGGLGGRPLDYSTGRIFMAGGGGAGDMNNNQNLGGSGGNGGGIVFALNYGNVSGTGTIIASGNNGQDCWSNSPPFGGLGGNDGAGGGGAGGTVIINTTGTVTGISIKANGGKGGNQILSLGSFVFSANEAEGPGGGGGGGYIAISSGNPTREAIGGRGGTTNSDGLNEFIPNGATSGGPGLPNEILNNPFLTASDVAICAGNSANLAVTVNGTLPAGAVIIWYSQPSLGTILQTGPNFTTGILNNDTTFYVGICPGTNIIPVNVTTSGSMSADLSNLSISHNYCGQSNGSINGIVITGGVAPITYTWNGISGGLNPSGLSNGNYSLVVTDNGGCPLNVGPFTISDIAGPSIDNSGLSIINESCGQANGSISGLNIIGGTAGFSYTWNGTTSTLNTNNLTAGNYNFQVTDSAGCTAIYGPINLINEAGPSFDLTGLAVQNDYCNQQLGAITGIAINGGTAPINYNWNGNAASNPDTIALSSGNYILTVSDANGCQSALAPITVNNVSGPSINLASMLITDASCNQSNGSISGIAVNNGSNPYSYSWNGNNTPSSDLTNQPAGTYALIVTDSAGCTATVSGIVINNDAAPTIDLNNIQIDNSYCGNSNGSISGILVNGINTPISYNWNGSATPSPNITGLNGGNYTLLVTDNNGCTATAGPFVINEITGPQIDESSVNLQMETCGNGNASISGINVIGGSGAIVYNWSNGGSTANLNNLNSGNYQLTITDSAGCTATGSNLNITNAANPLIDNSTLAITDESCGNNNGSINGLSVSGGTLPHNYLWNNINANLNPSGLSEGTYQLIVTDANGCSDTLSNILVNNISLDIQQLNLTITPEHCGQADGTISGITVGGGQPGYTYWWNGQVSAGLDISGLTSGTYQLVISDANGCADSISGIIVDQQNGPVIDLNNLAITADACDQNSGGINGISILPSSGISISWNTINATTTDLTGLSEGNYELTATDSFGCSASSGTINVPALNGPVINSNNINLNATTCGVNNGQISGLSVTGNGNINYLWNNGETNLDLNNLSPGNYQLVVTDSNNCTDTISNIQINASTSPVSDFSLSTTSIIIGDSIIINDNSVGNIVSWTYDLGNGAQLLVANGNYTYSNTGIYNICLNVVDSTGCVANSCQTIKVMEESLPLIIPNIITVNGDGINDHFTLQNKNGKVALTIFNRWGQEIFAAGDYQNDWKGQNMRGEEISEGTYYYVISIAENNETITGYFSLKK